MAKEKNYELRAVTAEIPDSVLYEVATDQGPASLGLKNEVVETVYRAKTGLEGVVVRPIPARLRGETIFKIGNDGAREAVLQVPSTAKYVVLIPSKDRDGGDKGRYVFITSDFKNWPFLLRFIRSREMNEVDLLEVSESRSSLYETTFQASSVIGRSVLPSKFRRSISRRAALGTVAAASGAFFFMTDPQLLAEAAPQLLTLGANDDEHNQSSSAAANAAKEFDIVQYIKGTDSARFDVALMLRLIASVTNNEKIEDEDFTDHPELFLQRNKALDLPNLNLALSDPDTIQKFKDISTSFRTKWFQLPRDVQERPDDAVLGRVLVEALLDADNDDDEDQQGNLKNVLAGLTNQGGNFSKTRTGRQLHALYLQLASPTGAEPPDPDNGQSLHREKPRRPRRHALQAKKLEAA